MANKNKRNWEELSARKGKHYSTDKKIEQKHPGKSSPGAGKLGEGKRKTNQPRPNNIPKRDDFAENESETDLIIGRNPVMEALKNQRGIEKLIISKNSQGSIAKIVGMARDQGIVIHYAEKSGLDRIANGRPHQGVIAKVSAYEYGSMEDVYSKAKNAGEDPFVVILDNIEDPHNLGAILRTAECAGAHGVIIPKRRSSGLTEVVVKASAGAVEYVPCVKVANIAQTIDDLKKEGFWIVACDMGDHMYYEQELSGRIALVVGSEGFGISKLVKEKCDYVLSIPLMGKITSLNASNAAAVLMYEVRRQRNDRK